MDEIKIAYKDDYPCIYEGINNYLSVFSLKRKKYILIFSVVSALCLLFFNVTSITKEADKILLIMECVCVGMLFITSVLLYIVCVKKHLRQVSSVQFLAQKEQQKEIIIRQDDIVFLRDYCKSNYYYDEFVAVIEGNKSISFVVEKNIYPVIFSKKQDNKEEASKFSVILKEKVGDRYIDKTKGGGK